MSDEITLKLLDILDCMDERIYHIESALEEISVEGFYFSSYGSDASSIQELRDIILNLNKEEVKE